MSDSTIGAAGDIVLGAAAIARATGLSTRQVFHLASKGALPGVFKLGGSLAMSRVAYRNGITARASAALPLAA